MSNKLNLSRMNARQRRQAEIDTPNAIDRVEIMEMDEEDFQAFVVGSLSALMVANNIRSNCEHEATAH